MKRNFLAFIALGPGLGLFLAACATAQPEPARLESSVPDELDRAIREASDYLNKNVPARSKLVILNVKSDYPPLSEYIIDVLTGNVVNDRFFTAVDRANLALIQQEMDFQLSGEVSDESAQSIGQKLGAQTIVSGSITVFGNLWRLTVRALGVEGATVQGMFNRNIPNGPSIVALTSGGPVVQASTNPRTAAPAGTAAGRSSAPSASTSAPAAPSSTAPAPVSTTYRIGDTGPAGGIIFYDKGNNSGGWRYLEGAPIETEVIAKWGAYEKTVGGTATAVGTGKRNTEIIVDMLNYVGEAQCAAQICENLVYGGYDDWFLPGKDELNLMYGNLKAKGLGRLYGEWYWSSSEGNQHDAYRQHFIDGSWPIFVGHFNKRVNGSVRAIRQF